MMGGAMGLAYIDGSYALNLGAPSSIFSSCAQTSAANGMHAASRLCFNARISFRSRAILMTGQLAGCRDVDTTKGGALSAWVRPVPRGGSSPAIVPRTDGSPLFDHA